MNSCCKQKAFTLTELLVVMVILVILFSIGVGSTNAIKGPVLAQMGGAELTSALKRAHKSAVKNGIPSAIVLMPFSGNTFLNVQSALLASDGQLETYFGFEDVTPVGATVTANGMKTGQTLTNNIPNADLVDGYFGNGLFTNNNSYSCSVSSGNSIYMEAQLRYGSGTTSSILGLSGYSIRVDANGGVYGWDGTNSFPSVDRPNINTEKWRKVGLMFTKSYGSGSIACNGALYVDGTMVGSANTGAVNNATTLSVGAAGTYVDIDEIKVYNLTKSDVVLNDLKSGFFVANGSLTTGSNAIIKNITLNAQGGLAGGASSDFIAFASTYVTGTTSGTSPNRLSDFTNTSTSRLKLTGAFANSLPESGYIIVPNGTNFELIQYKDFSAGTMSLVRRAVANTPQLSTNNATTFYYAIPVIFNSDGSIQ